MDKKIKKLECPFTLQIDEDLSSEFNDSHELTISFDEEPLFAFVDTMTTAYLQAKNQCYQQALQGIKILDEFCWEKLDEGLWNSYGVSTRVLLHAKDATKYFICKSTNCESEASEILKNIEDGGVFGSATELATINGCKSVAWSKFHEKAHRQVTESARLAVAGSPDCPLWHYILARALKHARREGDSIDKISAEEEASIARSCQLSDTPFYNVHLARMYLEQKKSVEAKTMFTKIFKANPQEQGILLRLAGAFTSLGNLQKASLCFEKAEEYPTNSMYHHYKGVFFIKTKEFEKAAFHLQKAKGYGYGSYRADLLYAWSMHKINDSFDFIDHLKAMLGQYTKIPKYEQQTLLHIAMHYHNKNDLKNTLTYLLKAIEFDPQGRQLENYRNTTMTWEYLNIYTFTHERLQEISNRQKLRKQMKDTVKKLHDYCCDYHNLNLYIKFYSTHPSIV